MNENSNSNMLVDQPQHTTRDDPTARQELIKKPKTWSKLKGIVEFSRKLVYSLNNDVPSNINFRQLDKDNYRIYFLAGTQKREITIKHVDVKLGAQYDKLTASTIFANTSNGPNFPIEKQQLTKEEQLLRERKRCSLSGITSYYADCQSGRLVFSERSELFYFDDQVPNIKIDYPVEISTTSKGAIDVQICPLDSNLVSYVLNDNLWIQDLSTKNEIQLTKTADPLKSGVPSYAVQEEFNRYTGYWWQPVRQVNADESVTYRIAYEEIDDSSVDLTYITPSCVNEFGYDSYRYPKAGTPNSKIFLKMVEITFTKDNKVNVVEKKMFKNFYELFSWYEYLVRADWTPDGQTFCVQIYDRLQCHSATILIPLDYFVLENNNELIEEMQTSSYDTPNVYCLIERTSDTWINVHNSMHFLNPENESEAHKFIRFIMANDETGFLHLYSYKISLDPENFTKVSEGVLKCNVTERKQITDGDWCIESDENVRVDQVNHLAYFTAYQNPLESHLYVVDYDNPLKVKRLTNEGFSHSVKMNKGTNLFTTVFSSLSTSYKTHLYQIENQHEGIDSLIVKQVAQIISREENNKALLAQSFLGNSSERFISNLTISSLLNLNIDSILSANSAENEEAMIIKHLFRPPQMFEFLTDDNCKLYGMIYLPHNYVPGVKYPTVLYVYGGPKAQIVTNSYKATKYSRFNILALLDYCVVTVDSRGSDNRGLAFESHLKKRMGTVEINDQVKGIEAAASKFNCIDMSRIGIYGWSYGGYMALMGLAQRPDIFKVAISGAPVTTWTLYDTAYTERYMGLPNENKEAYNKGSVISCAKMFPDEENRLLIIHGMIDENVHFAHTRQFIDALIKENKPYQLQIYPNERHGIRSPEASVHCEINFFSFLEQNL